MRSKSATTVLCCSAYFESVDADGEREDEDVPSGAKSGDGESDEEQDQEPDDAPQDRLRRHLEFLRWSLNLETRRVK